MKPVINKEACIGCGSCESICGAIFKLLEDGKAHIQPGDFEANKTCIQESINACPVQAISWEE
ncbi:MAG: ferredoxin [bacterium]